MWEGKRVKMASRWGGSPDSSRFYILIKKTCSLEVKVQFLKSIPTSVIIEVASKDIRDWNEDDDLSPCF